MRFAITAALAACLAAPTLADTICEFNVECYQTEACMGSGWEVSVDREAGTISSIAEALEIVHMADNGLQIVAEGEGSLNLLTIGESFSLFTTHIEGEPTVVTYVGECRVE